MKFYFLIIAVITIFALPANGFDGFDVHRVAPCRFWMPVASGGFACQNVPPFIVVPDAKSISDVLNEQNKRIIELEQKIADLELALKKQ